MLELGNFEISIFSNFSGITFGIMLITILMAIIVALQLVGSNAENIGCVTLKSPSPPRGAVKV